MCLSIDLLVSKISTNKSIHQVSCDNSWPVSQHYSDMMAKVPVWLNGRLSMFLYLAFKNFHALFLVLLSLTVTFVQLQLQYDWVISVFDLIAYCSWCSWSCCRIQWRSDRKLVLVWWILSINLTDEVLPSLVKMSLAVLTRFSPVLHCI